MPWRHVLFDTIYRIGRPIWDIPTPPEIIDVVEGAHALAPGRALDLGCGTSPNVAYLAQHGWDAIGVDISPTAIKKVKKNAEGIAGAHFVVADVTKLTGSGINGPFDLVIDNGCYHTLSEDGKEAYVPQVAAVMKADAPLMMWEGIRVADNEIPERFHDHFAIERTKPKSFPIQRLGLKFTLQKGKWYWLRRLGEDEGGAQR